MSILGSPWLGGPLWCCCGESIPMHPECPDLPYEIVVEIETTWNTRPPTDTEYYRCIVERAEWFDGVWVLRNAGLIGKCCWNLGGPVPKTTYCPGAFCQYVNIVACHGTFTVPSTGICVNNVVALSLDGFFCSGVVSGGCGWPTMGQQVSPLEFGAVVTLTWSATWGTIYTATRTATLAFSTE